MFRLRWSRGALDTLAQVWVQADTALRASITAAAHQIEQELQSSPAQVGESRSGGRRILLASPLGVIYRIEADGRTVSVLRLWLFRTQGQP